MIKTGAKFCHVCGEKLQRRYPGGDPENGPAQPLCSKGHDSIWDLVLDARHDILTACLEELETGDPHPTQMDKHIEAAASNLLKLRRVRAWVEVVRV